MNKKNIEAIGFAGVSVELNLSELIAIKEFIANANNKLTGNSKYNEVPSLLREALVFLGNIMPIDQPIMSIAEAHEGLFVEPELKEEATVINY